ncbi:DUF4268 domain-containing protein [Pseudacidovorax sp. NFM-22]|uniref:DUF4268 domain-containing protein n=1 Tax=Pseudacidovorax sp. NFM-22 TaxID=2744469 RepID=UPI001F40A10A|nr:DUF4268 domain-containing protein [Pseudacidovorax sp. NFM-22]
MTLFVVHDQQLKAVPLTTFAQEGMLERKHLQAMLHRDTSPLGEDLLVLREEFGQWQDSQRRIDLLCLDKTGTLVVVELKRTSDGGHMDLQAIRYAAMVSSMTLDQAIAARHETLGTEETVEEARTSVLEFLGLDSVDEAELTGEVRIILAAADFSQEITTSVIWLNRQGLDIRCIRLRPYKLGEQLLVDAAQIIPLPEAADYEIKIREQAEETRKVKTKRQELIKRFWTQFIQTSTAHTQLFAQRTATTDHWLSGGVGRSGFALTVSLTEDRARVECGIRLGRDNAQANKMAFHALLQQKAAIEAAFGNALVWDELPEKISSRIHVDMPDGGGWRSPESEWPDIQRWLAQTADRLEKALSGPIRSLPL